MARRLPRLLCSELTMLEERAMPSGSPTLDSWLKSSPNENAAIIYAVNGTPVTYTGPTTTWTGNTSTVLGDTQKISYSANSVYVQSPDLTSSVMGPWLNANGTPFPNLPTNQNRIIKIPRNPVAATTHTATNLGAIGLSVNGVSIFNMSDGMSYNTTTGTVVGNGAGYWNRDANVGEAATFDHAHAHQPGNGEYHYHISPTALREQLRDNISYHGTSATFPNDPNVILTSTPVGGTHKYDEYTSDRHHSPILGYAFDGFPVYGPYGYSIATNANSQIDQMTSSYRLRNITTRTSLPGFAAKAKFTDSVTLNAAGEYPLTAANTFGPPVNATYPLGTFIEDYEYVAGLGTLDMYNGRFTKTPEYPNGIYAYFITLDPADGDDVFPYSIGRQYYGAYSTASSGKVTSITETVSTYFDIASPQHGGSVRGVVYFDTNGNGTRDTNELGYSNVSVYLDANNNNTFDTGETTTSTTTDGGYELPVAADGTTKVRVIVPAGYTQTSAQPAAVTVSGGNAVFGVTVGLRVLPPTVNTSQVNDGSSQRSSVTKIAVTLSEAVTFPNGIANAFSVTRTTGGSIGFNATQSGNVITIAFTNTGSIPLEANGSVPNGRYTVTAIAANISGNGGFLDGNANGTGGDNGTVSFHRLFGDSNGDATVNGVDLDNFSNAFNTGTSDYDYNSDGTVNGVDLDLFGNAFNSSV